MTPSGIEPATSRLVAHASVYINVFFTIYRRWWDKRNEKLIGITEHTACQGNISECRWFVVPRLLRTVSGRRDQICSSLYSNKPSGQTATADLRHIRFFVFYKNTVGTYFG